jgi:hypothetical protein
VIDVAETTVTAVQAVPPTVTVAPTRNPVPVIVITVPPTSRPEDGEMDVTVGARTNVNSPDPVPDWVSAFVTRTFADPAEPAGVEHEIDVADKTTTEVHAAPPTATVAPATKPVPLIVIAVPPEAGPDVGETAVTAGGALTVISPFTYETT